MSTETLGTFRWTHRESTLFIRRFAGWLAVVLIFSLPAVAVTVGVIPEGLAYLFAGIVAIATSLTDSTLTNTDESDQMNIGEITFREALAFIIIVYSMFAAGFSFVLFLGVVLGILAGGYIGSATIALLIALLFPILDNKIGHHSGYSIFGMVTLAVITIFDLLATVYFVSQSVRDQARRGRRRMLN